MMGILAHIVLNEENRIRIRNEQMLKKRLLRDISNPFDIGDETFFHHYRMYPHMAIHLIGLLEDRVPIHPIGIPLHLQVLSVLRLLAEGSYQKAIGTDLNHPMSQPTLSRCLHRIIRAINELAPQFIKFPANAEERAAVQERFREHIGFPGVLGAIDCTLPKIVTPSDHEEAYLNYKRQHSLNVVDMNYKIFNIRICSGSTNDRFVWNWSEIREHMFELRANEAIVRNEGYFYIIGDGGYSPSRVLLTPIAGAARGTPEYEYSDAQRRTRVIVENVFGILKSKWRCLNKLRGLHYDSITAAEIVQACAVLHNFLRNMGMPCEIQNNANEEEVNNMDNDMINNNEIQDNEYYLGLVERQTIINTHFAHPR